MKKRKITPEALQALGFVPALLRGDDEDYSKTYNLECVYLNGFENIHILSNDDIYMMVGQIMGYWHIITDRISPDENSYLQPDTIGLSSMKDLKLACYYITGYQL